MNPGLMKLLKLRWFAAGRQLLRQLRRPKPAVLLLLGFILYLALLAPSVVKTAQSAPPDVEAFRSRAPFVMFLICLMPLVSGNSRHAFHFTPAEVDFLFPGPFTRRELLAAKLVTMLPGVLFGTLVLSAVMARYVLSWAIGFAGALAAMIFIQLTGMAILLVQQIVAARALSLIRKLAVGLVVVGIVLLFVPMLAPAGQSDGLPLPPALPQVIAAPFMPFVLAMSAESWIDFLCWGGISLAIDVAVLVVVLRLDIDYSDAAVAASQDFYRRIKQLRQRGGMASMTIRSARLACPRLPWAGGVGPTARRQLTAALRGILGIAFFAAILFLPMIAGVLIGGHGNSAAIAAPLAINVIVFSVMLTRMVPFDFRSDLEQMDWLKSLPVRASAIAIGELVAPVVLMTAMQLTFLGLLAAATDSGGQILAAVAPFTVPVNVISLGIDNLLFLLLPSRTPMTAAVGFQQSGRAIIEMVAKMFFLVLAVAVAAAPSAGVYWLSGGSWPAALVVGWLALTAVAIGIVAAVAVAFSRFDVSLDVP